jgi:carboxyl-terminal processing protease
MSHLSYRRGLCLVVLSAVSIGLGFYGAPRLSAADSSPVAVVDQLESQAADALRQGHFDVGSDLLAKAATVANDPEIKSLAASAADFRKLEHTFDAERQTEFEKNVKDVHILLDHNMGTYAIDVLQQAYLRAADKDAFRQEKWVDDLVKTAADNARQAEADAHWITALRIYADLAGLDPYDPVWKDALKSVTRRIRLLMVYAPDQFKVLEKAETDSRKAADALLHPTTQPGATADASTGDLDNSDFKMDWHDAVHGASLDMLLDSLSFADRDYFRQVDVQNLMKGGIEELRLVATTKGMEKTFTGLQNQDKKNDFLWALDQASSSLQQINADNDDAMTRTIVTTLLQADKDTINLPDDVFVSEFTDGSLDKLDPFSDMIWPYEMAEFLQLTQGELIGVGIQIESADNGDLRVVSPIEDSPAYKAGIKADDVITRIDGKNAKGITTTEAVKTITGPEHTFVVLTVRSPDGKVHSFPIERRTINVVSVKGYVHRPGGGWDYFIDPTSQIAYLRLTNFTAKTTVELTEALDTLQQQGAKGLILDLRGNPGGLLSAAVEVSSQFIRKGVIVSTHPDRDTENRPTVNDAEPDRETTDMPLAVLVNQYSASASEIVSGALKDHGRATIVGERTYGKGSVQQLFPLADKSAFLKLTTAHYYLPSGRCLHREENSKVWGVDPDVTIDMTPEQMRAAIDARQEMEVLRDAGAATTQPAKNLLTSDPQLAGALLVLRMKLAGVQI